MYRYKYNKSYHHKSKKARRTTVLAVIFSIAVFGAVGYIGYDIFKQSSKKDTPVSREVYSSVQGASINYFRSEYFQFQTDKSWQEVSLETKKNHYVYRSFKGPLVEHDLVIDVNPTSAEVLANARTTHVLPITVESTGRFNIADSVGEHCKTLMPKNALPNPTRVTQKQVSFNCAVDAVLYQVQVGVVGGTTDMLLTRPDGTKATYRITYRNLRFTPDESMIRTIIDTFQLR